MKRTFLVIAMAVGACSCTAPVSPAAGQATATPASVQSLASCRLPLWLYDKSTNVGTGYFLQVPGFGVTAAKPPATSRYAFAAYASSARRWLPVFPSQIAPGGAYYTYNEVSGQPEVERVHVVDLATGADRVVAQGGDDTGYEAFDVEADGIYVSRPNNGPTTLPGLWRMDPRTGAVTRLDATHVWRFVNGDYAYTSVPNPADPVVEQGGEAPDTLLRLDLRSGTLVQLYRVRGAFADVLGFDWTHRPIVIVGGTQVGLAILTGPSTAQPIPVGEAKLTFDHVDRSLVADSDGFWFTADQGVFRYTSGGGIRQVWGRPARIAGACA